MFAPVKAEAFGRLNLRNDTHTLSNCRTDVIDQVRYDALLAVQECSTTYCGTGTCVITSSGPACECDRGTVSRVFTDLDGLRSVTCVSKEMPVDLEAGGVELPDRCATINCGLGTCLDLGGFAACECDAGAAADATKVVAPTCLAILDSSGGPGAEEYSGEMAQLPVCAPAPPDCGEYGWNVPSGVEGKKGFACAYSIPSEEDLEPASSPSCEQLGRDNNGGCTAGSSSGGLTSLFLFGLVFLLAFRRRGENATL